MLSARRRGKMENRAGGEPRSGPGGIPRSPPILPRWGEGSSLSRSPRAALVPRCALGWLVAGRWPDFERNIPSARNYPENGELQCPSRRQKLHGGRDAVPQSAEAVERPG